MNDDSARDSLPRFLAQRARNASDGRLALNAAAGLIAAAAAAVVPSPGNVVLGAAGTCFFAFGLWGITDRELGERREAIGPIGGVLLVAARAFAAVVGLVGGLGVIFGGLSLALGRWVS